MVGLDKFSEAFASYPDNYVIIGGTACDIVLSDSVMQARATHDIDMIVIIENITPAFSQRFWEFIKEGGYRPEKRKQIANLHPSYELYRFIGGRPGYPEMIELLSRHPDSLGDPKGLTIEPLRAGDDISSLSAIILDDDLYKFTVANSILTDGIRHASSVALIALKARAYLNLLKDKAEGRHVNTKDIKKHRSDVLKNLAATETDYVMAPESIICCVKDFVASIRRDYSTLSEALARSLDVELEYIDGLLDQLDELFVPQQ